MRQSRNFRKTLRFRYTSKTDIKGKQTPTLCEHPHSHFNHVNASIKVLGTKKKRENVMAEISRVKQKRITTGTGSWAGPHQRDLTPPLWQCAQIMSCPGVDYEKTRLAPMLL